MSAVVKTISVDEAVSTALAQIEDADPGAPRTLNDHLTGAGLHDPYRRAVALRVLRAKLKPGGSHAHLSKQRLWAYERERWAKELGLEKGKPEVAFEPETEMTRALAKAVDASSHLPEIAREAVGSIRGVLAARANRKLDETSATMVGESVEDLMHELEVQARLIEEKDARIEQAEEHNDQLRLTNDRLLALMEKLTGGPASDGAVTLRTDQGEKGDVRSRTN